MQGAGADSAEGEVGAQRLPGDLQSVEQVPGSQGGFPGEGCDVPAESQGGRNQSGSVQDGGGEGQGGRLEGDCGV